MRLQNQYGCRFRLFLTQFFKRANIQGMGGADPDTGRLHVVFSSNVAEIALGHLSVLRELRRPEGTGKFAAMTSDAEIAIDNNGTVFLFCGRSPPSDRQ